jgi:hypothetical protein
MKLAILEGLGEARREDRQGLLSDDKGSILGWCGRLGHIPDNLLQGWLPIIHQIQHFPEIMRSRLFLSCLFLLFLGDNSS